MHASLNANKYELTLKSPTIGWGRESKRKRQIDPKTLEQSHLFIIYIRFAKRFSSDIKYKDIDIRVHTKRPSLTTLMWYIHNSCIVQTYTVWWYRKPGWISGVNSTKLSSLCLYGCVLIILFRVSWGFWRTHKCMFGKFSRKSDFHFDLDVTGQPWKIN